MTITITVPATIAIISKDVSCFMVSWRKVNVYSISCGVLIAVVFATTAIGISKSIIGSSKVEFPASWSGLKVLFSTFM